jgi:hypothetical protein
MEFPCEPVGTDADTRQELTSKSARGRARKSVRFRLAQSRSDLEGAFRILQKRYAESGLTPNVGAKLRVMPYHLWSDTQVFVALHQDRVIGSVTLVRDGIEHGLPMESTYPEAIQKLRSKGVRIGEICCLCVGSDNPNSSTELFAGLTRIMTFHARFMQLDSLLAVVHPRHGKFYRHAMGFKEIGGLSSYRQVGGQPGIPVLGELQAESGCRDRWKRVYFAGNFSAGELEPRPMSMIDREYFRRFLHGYMQPVATRRAA